MSLLRRRKMDSEPEYRNPKTVEELTQRNIETIVELDAATRANRTSGERLADNISSFCGSVAFVWTHIFWFSAWILINTLPPLKPWRFDVFPFFFLSFIVGLEAIFLVSFILISQKRDEQLAERRNHLLLQIALLTEQENTKMLQMLRQMAEHSGANVGGDPEIRVFEAATRPDEIVAQIEQITEATNGEANDKSG